ncbi:MAG: DUF1109 family protein [Aestuariivirga sp.]|nr:DUF1109 family protein [Aestuariivirga sp.]
MKTDDLIQRLAADTGSRPAPAAALWLAVGAAIVLAAAAMLLSVGPRPDLATAAGTWRFLAKAAVMVTLAATSLLVLRRAIYPEGLAEVRLWAMLAAPALLLAMVAIELMLMPSTSWGAAATGTNWASCLVLVPAFGILPLAVALWAIRQGAPTRPMLTGFIAGLLSGGIAATAYATHCPDDSPLFVVLWYPVGILLLGIAGAVLGRRVLRW